MQLKFANMLTMPALKIQQLTNDKAQLEILLDRFSTQITAPDALKNSHLLDLFIAEGELNMLKNFWQQYDDNNATKAPQ